MLDYYISKAIRYCGSQKKLALKMGVKPERVSYLLNSARKISIEDAVLIERATAGTVSRYQLLQGLSTTLKQQLDGQPFVMSSLPISERVKQGIAYEEALKGKGRKKIEQNNRQKSSLLRQNFDAKKHRCDVMAAEYAVLGNRQSYREAKRVVELGSSALIQAMDAERIGISTAARLTRYPAEEQERILNLSHKEIIHYGKEKKKPTNPKNLNFCNELMILLIMMRGYLILKQQQKGDGMINPHRLDSSELE